MASDPITSWQIEGEKVEAVTDLLYWPPKSLQTVTVTMKLKDTWKESYDKPRQYIEKQRHHFGHKGPYSQSYTGFSSSHVQM